MLEFEQVAPVWASSTSDTFFTRPNNSTVLRANLDYRLNEKWIASANTAYDFEETGNIGQTIAVTRIGESLLLRLE